MTVGEPTKSLIHRRYLMQRRSQRFQRFRQQGVWVWYIDAEIRFTITGMQTLKPSALGGSER
jgi:hypothetical protein